MPVSSQWRDLRGKIVMVTRASLGIGWELCIDLAKYGCRIIAAAHQIDRLNSLCDEINTFGIPDGHTIQNGVLAVAVELDISADGPTIKASVCKAWDAFGHIDALINNAGIIGVLQSPLDLLQKDWDETFNTNLRGSWLVSKYVCLQMRAFSIKGSVINISSIAGLNRVLSHGKVAYVSSKSALDAMTKIMAMELGKYNIRVNSIAPGIFNSEITKELVKKKWINNVASRTVPLKDFGKTNPSITSLVRFLILDLSDYITGNIFIVDAGLSLSGVPLYSSL